MNDTKSDIGIEKPEIGDTNLEPDTVSPDIGGPNLEPDTGNPEIGVVKPEPRTKLTKADLDATLLDRELVFHYSREHRLAKASSKVQALNEPGPQRRAAGLGPLTATRGHTTLLISIVILGIAISFAAAAKRETYTKKLGGNAVAVAAERIEGAIYLTVTKTVKTKDREQAYTGAVNMVISPAVSAAKNAPDAEAPIAVHRVLFTPKPQEEFGIAVPFDAPTLIVIMQTDDERHTVFTVKPK